MKKLLFGIFFMLAPAIAAAQNPVTITPMEGTPADAESNTEPFLGRVGMRGYFFNGSTWDRFRGDTTSGLWVNIKNATLAVTKSGTWDVTNAGTFAVQAGQNGTWTMQPGNTANTTPWLQIIRDASGNARGANVNASNQLSVSVDNTVTVGSHAVTNAGTFAVQDSEKVADDAAFTIATTKLQPIGYLVDQSSTDSVNEGDIGAPRMTLDRIAYAGTAAVAETAQATASCYVTSAASTNATNCKASAGNVYAIHVTNTTTTNYFLRMYNLGSSPTCSSSTGFVETIPALGASANGGVNGRVVPAGEGYDTGIGFCLTGGGSSTDNTNAATGVYVSIRYK